MKIQTNKIINDVKILENLKTSDKVLLSTYSEGIPCLVLNGTITDKDGVPFRNEKFQEMYQPLCLKAQECKIMIIGRIINKNADLDQNQYELSNFLDSKKSYILPILKNIFIEIEDVQSSISSKLKPITRFNMMTSILMGLYQISGINVGMQNFIRLESIAIEQKDIDDFIEKEMKEGKTFVYRDEEERILYIAPYSKAEGKIIKYTKTERTNRKGKERRYLRSVYLQSKELQKIIKIEYFKENECTLAEVLLNDVEKKRIESIPYKIGKFRNNIICVRKI